MGADDGAGAGMGGRVCELNGRAGVVSAAGRGLYEEVTEALVGKGRRDREMYVRKGAE